VLTRAPRLAPSDLAAQLDLGLAVRDSLTRVANIVASIRSVQAQLEARSAGLTGNAAAAPWLRAAGEVLVKCAALERQLHKPDAQVGYDILARGARLYSRLNYLFSFVKDSAERPPTQGMREVYADQLRELERLDGEWRYLVAGDPSRPSASRPVRSACRTSPCRRTERGVLRRRLDRLDFRPVRRY
jgi:hypothetical protein